MPQQRQKITTHRRHLDPGRVVCVKVHDRSHSPPLGGAGCRVSVEKEEEEKEVRKGSIAFVLLAARGHQKTSKALFLARCSSLSNVFFIERQCLLEIIASEGSTKARFGVEKKEEASSGAAKRGRKNFILNASFVDRRFFLCSNKRSRKLSLLFSLFLSLLPGVTHVRAWQRQQRACGSTFQRSPS